MKCKVCGNESGKYPLCRVCNIKKERGEIIKCTECGNWHYRNQPCTSVQRFAPDDSFVYEAKPHLISDAEKAFYTAIQHAVPTGYIVFPQINLASFIERIDGARFHNELFRNVDFLITDADYAPKVVIEINDQTHLTRERHERDERVQKICEEAGIPIIKFWTSYGVNPEYIRSRINEVLDALPVLRIHHYSRQEENTPQPQHPPVVPPPFYPPRKKKGCYIATCVYGSYDCPEVWTLRRYRDHVLSRSRTGRAFISIYYTVSPALVACIGHRKWFCRLWKKGLDQMVLKLKDRGFNDTPYRD